MQRSLRLPELLFGGLPRSARREIQRFVRLGIVASIQPVFVGEYSRWAEDHVGPLRARWVLRTRNLLDADVTLAAGTDYPAPDSGMPIANVRGLPFPAY